MIKYNTSVRNVMSTPNGRLGGGRIIENSGNAPCYGGTR